MTQYTKPFTALLVGIAFGSLFTFVFYPAPKHTPANAITTKAVCKERLVLMSEDGTYTEVEGRVTLNKDGTNTLYTITECLTPTP